MIYEIVNPSDPYTCDVPDFKVAAVMVVILGEGQYALKSETKNVPMFLVDGHDEWFQEQFGQTFEEAGFSLDKIALADAFDSVLIGTEKDRNAYFAALEFVEDIPTIRHRWMREWHDKRRTGITDLKAMAAWYVQELRACT
jgi:hypothetical protein